CALPISLDRVNGSDVVEYELRVGRPFGAPLLLVVGEEEGSLFPDRAAQRAAELILAQRVFPPAREGVARVERVVAKEVVERAVEAVAALLRDDVDDPP